VRRKRCFLICSHIVREGFIIGWLKALFEGKHGKKSMIKKNVDWASANMEQILNWLQIDGTGKASTWWAEPLIVIGQAL
jgi:hypothetical protein